MKRILIAATALSALAAPAFADATNIGLEAIVEEVCTITDQVTEGAAATTPIVLDIDDGKHTTTLAGTGASLVTVAMSCNMAFTVDLASEEGAVDHKGRGTTMPAVIGGNFDDHIDYTATAAFVSGGLNAATVAAGGQFTTGDVNVLEASAPNATAFNTEQKNVLQTGAGGSNSGGAYAGSFTVSIETEATSHPLLEGTYDDVLRVTLSAS